jgi:organic radical activating enzyme
VNTQKPEPRDALNTYTLDLHSIFFTIQGEGPFAGHRAIFVRFAGCNLQCPGCDTEYTQGRARWDVADLVNMVHDLAEDNEAPKCLVVVTGGEPLRQRIGYFVSKLFGLGHPVQIESNGMFAPDPDLCSMLRQDEVTLVVSPKTKRIHVESFRRADAFKYVLDHRSMSERDGLPIRALDHPSGTHVGVARPRPGAPVYINPYDSGDPIWNLENLRAAADSAKRYGYILGVQLHKLVGLE